MQTNLPEEEDRAAVDEWMEELGPTPVRFSRREWTLLSALLALFAVCCWGFDARGLMLGRLPGLGMALAALILEATALLYLGRRALREPLAIAMLAFDALLALTYAVYANMWMRWLNLALLAATLPMALFGLAGHCVRPLNGPAALVEGGLRAVSAAFANLDKPFVAAGEALRGNRHRARGAALGMLIALPLLALIVALLVSADAVFADLFTAGFRAVLGEVPAFTLMRAALTLLMTLIAFSAVYALRCEREALRIGEDLHLRAPAAAVRLPLAAFNIVYALFVYVQFANLFGGAQTAAMTGGYAEYARSGFFQLMFVAALNLCVFGLSRALCPEDRPVRWLLLALVAQTSVILVSAAWRMRLYVAAYGLTVLRLMTLWGMCAVALSLAAAAWKLAFPRQNVFRALLMGLMVTWLLLNAADADRLISRYNAEGYLRGALARVDVGYLSQLSGGAREGLAMLAEADVPGAAEAAESMREATEKPVPWLEWSLRR